MVLWFLSYHHISIQYLLRDEYCVSEKKNLVFATGLNADFNTVAIEDEDEIGLLTGNVRGKIVYNAGVGYYNSNEIVWLLTTTA